MTSGSMPAPVSSTASRTRTKPVGTAGAVLVRKGAVGRGESTAVSAMEDDDEADAERTCPVRFSIDVAVDEVGNVVSVLLVGTAVVVVVVVG